MKTLIGILLAISSISAYSQFPEPSDFDFSFEYIMIDESGYCDGEWVLGPTYCSHFNWSAPDTSNISSTFDYYNLYFNAYGQDTTLYLIVSLTDTFFNIEAGYVGEMWVTAVYSDPIGESEPSNIIINLGLPISVNENHLENEMNIFFDKANQEIRIKNVVGISRINIFNCQGKLINSDKAISNKINIESFPTGLYIIEIIKNNQEVIRHKIIK